MIIFLDIDGPMIPASQFMFHEDASFDQHFCEKCVKVLRHICEKTDAQIVLNTTHNRKSLREPSESSPGIVGRFVEHGLDVFLHEDTHTLYPSMGRLEAINEWLERHPEVTKWVAFDDANIEDERAYRTSSDHGIGYGEYRHAMRVLHGVQIGAVLL